MGHYLRLRADVMGHYLGIQDLVADKPEHSLLTPRAEAMTAQGQWSFVSREDTAAAMPQ